MARVLLYAPQDFHNVCLLARTLEALGHSECHVFDPLGLVRDSYGKSRTRELRAVSAGAFERVRWNRVAEPRHFIAEHPGRVIGTVADRRAPALTRFRFVPDDLLLFGSETHGLPPEIIENCDATVTIPTDGQTQSLNLAVASGIVLFEFQRQMVALASMETHAAISGE